MIDGCENWNIVFDIMKLNLIFLGNKLEINQ